MSEAEKSELQTLAAFNSEFEKRPDYYNDREISPEGWVQICRLKDKTNGVLDRRLQAARQVIDQIARRVGIDPDNTGYYLYTPDGDGSAILSKIDEYFSRGGDKVKLKKRLDELETENAILRSLVQK